MKKGKTLFYFILRIAASNTFLSEVFVTSNTWTRLDCFNKYKLLHEKLPPTERTLSLHSLLVYLQV